jgi:hypothetical protein
MSEFTDAMQRALEDIQKAETPEDRRLAEDVMALLIRKQTQREAGFDPKAAACRNND